jgi:hypothetical protein
MKLEEWMVIMADAERYRPIHARFAAMNSGQQADFLALLGLPLGEQASLSKFIDAELEK